VGESLPHLSTNETIQTGNRTATGSGKALNTLVLLYFIGIKSSAHPYSIPTTPQDYYIYAHIRSRSKFFPKIFLLFLFFDLLVLLFIGIIYVVNFVHISVLNGSLGLFLVFCAQVIIWLIKEIWFTNGDNLFRICLNMVKIMSIFIETEYAMLVNY
jgi:hypothetical protein